MTNWDIGSYSLCAHLNLRVKSVYECFHQQIIIHHQLLYSYFFCIYEKVGIETTHTYKRLVFVQLFFIFILCNFIT